MCEAVPISVSWELETFLNFRENKMDKITEMKDFRKIVNWKCFIYFFSKFPVRRRWTTCDNNVDTDIQLGFDCIDVFLPFSFFVSLEKGTNCNKL